MKKICALVLAAGKGTRMKSATPKVLHKMLGRPVISYVLNSLRSAGITDVIVVIGYGSELLKEYLEKENVKTVLQKELLGSGDAVSASRKLLEKQYENVLVVCGDMPLIQGETIKELLMKHKSRAASATIMTAQVKDPTGYGRIVRGSDKNILKIVEEEDAELYEEVINEVNTGSYCFRVKDLFESLLEVKAENAKKEYFLTDVIGILHKKNRTIDSLLMGDACEMIGINTRMDLAEANARLKRHILKTFMYSGVTIEDPDTTLIYPDVKIGQDTVIYPNTVIESDVEIGGGCHIGPFARIRGGVRLGDNVEIGNFVELVRTSVGNGTKIKHHTYLGDTICGRGINIGAGTITANYDGKKKNVTVIEDSAFIGVGAILIAPLKIGKSAMVGAGAVVLRDHDVPGGSTVAGVPARVLKKNNKK